MLSSEHSIVIAAPIEKVFDTVAGIVEAPRWTSIVKNVKITSAGVIGVGTTFVESVEFMGQRAEVDKIVTVFERPRKYAVKNTSGPVAHALTLTLEPLQSGTEVRLLLEAEEPSGMPLLGPVIVTLLKNQVDGDLVWLKKYIEGK